jgi:hypothetical protein
LTSCRRSISQAADAEQRLEQPFEQAALVDDDVGAQRHARPQGTAAAEGDDVLPLQVCTRPEQGRRTHLRGHGALRNFRDPRALHAEFLVWERLVAQVHRLARIDEAGGAARQPEFRLQQGPFGEQYHDCFLGADAHALLP